MAAFATGIPGPVSGTAGALDQPPIIDDNLPVCRLWRFRELLLLHCLIHTLVGGHARDACESWLDHRRPSMRRAARLSRSVVSFVIHPPSVRRSSTLRKDSRALDSSHGRIALGNAQRLIPHTSSKYGFRSLFNSRILQVSKTRQVAGLSMLAFHRTDNASAQLEMKARYLPISVNAMRSDAVRCEVMRCDSMRLRSRSPPLAEKFIPSASKSRCSGFSVSSRINAA